ncbi:hypothetical protein DXG03_006334 [Asterophora parasitica]|uniref:Uncharacterized protein n=1 Tax=Asterophora parasitica TaxID=117018 RepID=A0A9P7G8U5_9AGAR|nr:hypothetical protein DXG03_006334 [Asterophora parasitica]
MFFRCANNVRCASGNSNIPDIDLGAPCPLCRSIFDRSSIVKLHIDVEIKDISTADNDAKRLQNQLLSIAEAGATETALRELVAEVSAFVKPFTRDKYTELRNTHRMVAYLGDIKRKYRVARNQVEADKLRLKALEEEKAEVERRAKDERDAALAIETSLREHCLRSSKVYEEMVGAELARLRSTQSQTRVDSSQQPDASTPEYIASIDARLASYHEERVRTSGAAVTDPESYLVSPLPQFTGGFPSLSTNAFPLPDIDYDIDMEPEILRSVPSAATPQPTHTHPAYSIYQAYSRNASTNQQAPATTLNRSAPIPIPEREREPVHSGDNDYDIHRQTSSHNNRLPNHAHPQSHRTPGEGYPHPPSPPRLTSASAAASRPTRVSSTADETTLSSSAASQAAHFKHAPLRNMLTDSHADSASSLSNPSTRIPSSSRPSSYSSENRSSSSSYLSHPSMDPGDRQHHSADAPSVLYNSRENRSYSSAYPPPHPPVVPHDRQPHIADVLPTSSTSPYISLTTGSSSASTAAKLLEKQRLAEKAERKERERAERERIERESRERERPKGSPREGVYPHTESSDRHRRAGEGSSSTSTTQSQYSRLDPSIDRSSQVSTSSSRHYSSTRDSVQPSSSASTSASVLVGSTYGSQWVQSNGGHSSVRSGDSSSHRGNSYGADKYGPSKASMPPVLSATRA